MKKLFIGAAFCLALGLMTACEEQKACWQIDIKGEDWSETYYIYGTRSEAETFVKNSEEAGEIDGWKVTGSYKKLDKSQVECAYENDWM